MKLNLRTDACDLDRMESFLQGELNDAQEREFTLHLNACENCRHALQQQAAEPEAWREAEELLRPSAFDRPGADGPSDSATVQQAARQPIPIQYVLDALAPTDDPQMLGRIGGYEVSGVVGAGGMGVVLKAVDRSLDRTVAIKVLAPHLASGGAARKRFAREAKAAAAVLHANVIAIHSVSNDEALPYLVMPYLRGTSLQKRLDEEGPLSLAEILRIGSQIAAGLAAAHAQGLVHRDIKPANILLEEGIERVAITDFGLARAVDDATITHSGAIAGTPQYMSPEQARGEAVDGRSDLFSLGSVMYAMCTGRPPFRAETNYGVMRRITDHEPTPIRQINPDVPEWLCSIVARLMSKRAADRIESAAEVAELLETCLAHVQQPAVVPLPASLVLHAAGRRWITTSRGKGAITMVGTCGIVLLGIVLYQAFGLPLLSNKSLPDSDRGSNAAAQPVAAQPAAAQQDTSRPETTEGTPKRLHQFTDLTTGHDVTIACSADGKLIALANGNPTLIMLGGGRSKVADGWKPSVDILDAETGKIVATLKLTTADEDTVLAATERISHVEATALAFSPDGSMVAVGTSIGQVKFYNTMGGELARTLDDKPSRLADKQTPDHWKTLPRAMGKVSSLAFSPDGKLLATCGESFADYSDRFDGISRLGLRRTGPGRLKVWDAQTGTLKYDLVGHNDEAYAVAFSPDGNLLASAGRWLKDRDFGNGVILWNAHTGEQIHSLIRTTANGGTRAIAFSPDSKLLAMGTQRFDDDNVDEPSTGGVSVVHVSSGIEDWLVTVPGWAKPLTFSPDGKSVAVLCGGRSIRFLDTEQGALKHEIRRADSPEGVRWSDFALCGRGNVLAVGGVDKKRKVSVEVWSTPARGNNGAPASQAPGKATTSQVEPIKHFTTEAPVRTIACSADGKLVAIANGGPTLIMQENGTSRVKDDWKPSAEVLDAKTGKTVARLKLTTAEEEAVLAATERVSHFEVEALAFSPDGSAVAVGTTIGQVKLFDPRTGELVRSLDDERAKLADKETPENWKSLHRAMGSARSLAFSPDGKLLATCGDSFGDLSRVFSGVDRLGERGSGPGRLKVWEVKTGTLKHDLDGHSYASDVAFSPDGRLLASAGRWSSNRVDGTGAILWNAQTGEKVRTVEIEANGGARSVVFSPDGKRMATVSLHFDLDKPDDGGTGGITVAHVASGVVQWRRTFSCSASAAVFFTSERSVIALYDANSLLFMDNETGESLAVIGVQFSDQGARWNDLVTAKQGHVLAIGGLDKEHKGSVEVWNFDNADTAPESAPQKDGDN